MKHLKCTKCADNQRKAGEALGLFNEALGELVDVVGVLEHACRQLERKGANDAELAPLRDAITRAGERQRVENGIREIVRPS